MYLRVSASFPYELPAECYPCSLQVGVHVLLAALLAGWVVLLPVANGICVLDYELVYPREGLREKHGSLKETQVASMLSQGEYHVGHLFYRQRGRRSFSSAVFTFEVNT